MASRSLLTKRAFNIHLLENDRVSKTETAPLYRPVRRVEKNVLLKSIESELCNINSSLTILDHDFPSSIDNQKFDFVARDSNGTLVFIEVFEKLEIHQLNHMVAHYEWSQNNYSFLRHVFKNAHLSSKPKISFLCLISSFGMGVMTMLNYMTTFPIEVFSYKFVERNGKNLLLIERPKDSSETNPKVVENENKFVRYESLIKDNKADLVELRRPVNVGSRYNKIGQLTDEEINDFLDVESEEEEITESYDLKQDDNVSITPIRKSFFKKMFS